MTEEEFMLFDRIEKIKQIINKYGEENFYISFSGGKDSTVLHYLVDLALPGNKIPRVFINTGIEYIYIYISLLKAYLKRMIDSLFFHHKNLLKKYWKSTDILLKAKSTV